MICKNLILVLLLYFDSLNIVAGIKCYNCGYFELSDGKKIPIHDRWEGYDKVAFCDDFVESENNTIETGLVSKRTFKAPIKFLNN